MVKTAICFFGQVKNYNDAIYASYLEHVEKNIKSPFDYYLVTYNNTHIKNPKNGEDHSIDYNSINRYFTFDNCSVVETQSVKNIDYFASSLVEQYGSGWDGDSKEGSIISTIFAIRQLYGLKILYNMVKNKYDYYLLIRPDAFFTRSLTFPDNLNHWDVVVPKFDSWWGYNDRMAMCNEKGLEAYCSRFDHIMNCPQRYHSEKYLKYILDKHGVNVFQTDSVLFDLVRANGHHYRYKG